MVLPAAMCRLGVFARGLCSSCAEQGGTAGAAGSLPWRTLVAFSLARYSQLRFISARS